MNKKILIGVAIAVVVLLGGFFALKGDGNLSGITNLSGLAVGSDGFSVTGVTSLSNLLTSGLVTLNGGSMKSNTNSTSTTATTQTLAVADIQGYDSVILTPNTGALTLTFFASSSATSWLPTAGDRQETCFYNATGTTAATITFVAGTGIDFERTATSTTAGAVTTAMPIPAGGHGCFTFMRQPATASTFDISALYTPFVNGD